MNNINKSIYSIYNLFEKNIKSSLYKICKNNNINIIKDNFSCIFNNIALSYSGGLDSSALLDMLILFTKKYKIKLFAFYINHKMSINSFLWQEHCKNKCTLLKVNFDFYELNVNFKIKNNIEETYRIKRYFALKKLCKKNSIKLLLTAHNKNDQIETILLRILRGTGILGITGIHMVSQNKFLLNTNIFLIRPLLNILRIDLEYYVNFKKISFIFDESNINIKYRRNILRNEIIPKLLKFFPGFKKSIIRLAYHAKSSEKLLKILANQDFKICKKKKYLNIFKIQKLLNSKRIDNLLRYWLISKNICLPSTTFIKELRKKIITFKLNSNICIKYSNIYIRSYKNNILITKIFPEIKKKNKYEFFIWKGEKVIHFLNFYGSLFFKKSIFKGISKNWLYNQNLYIRKIKNNDKLKLSKNRLTQNIKKYYQSIGIPYWKRNYLPILSLNNEIIYVIKIGINYKFNCNIDKNNNYVFLWKTFLK